MSGYGLGSALWSPVESMAANPQDLHAVESNSNSSSSGSSRPCECDEQDSSSYFCDESILSRIPAMLKMIGCTYLVIQAVGILLIRAPDDEEVAEVQNKNAIIKAEEEQQTHSVKVGVSHSVSIDIN